MAQNPLRMDPSRTGLLRRAFVRDLEARFAKLAKAVLQLVGTEDDFALTTNAKRFKFLTSDKKLKEFNRWLKKQIDAGILEAVPATGEPRGGQPWTYKYIESAYRTGAVRSYIASHPELAAKGADYLGGSRAEFLRSSFSNPERLSKVRLLYTRSYEGLKGITSQMSTQMSRVMADGMAHGKGPMEVARTLHKTITGISKARAKMLARTEIIHAHAEGQLDAFEDLEVDEVTAEVEFQTAGDDGVCPECEELDGEIYTTEEAHGIIPVHPNCVVGSSVIDAPDVLAVTRATYTGPVVEVLTTNGRRLAVTEHHVLLTQRGWVFAKDLTEADCLFDTTKLNGVAFGVGPNQENGVPPIAETFEFLINGLHLSARQPLGADKRGYFHGDGRSCDEKIDVVLFNRILGGDLKTYLSGEFQELPIVMRSRFTSLSASLASQRALSQFLRRTATSTDGIMGCLGPLPALLGRLAVGEDLVGRGLASQTNPILQQHAADDASGGVKLTSNLQFEGPGHVQANDALDDVLRQGLANTLPTEARIPIQCVKQRHVSSLLVYDVSTSSTMYGLNGVLSSNCRCCWSSDVSGILKKAGLPPLDKLLKQVGLIKY